MQEHILVLIAWSLWCAACGAVAALSFCRGAPQVPAEERPGPVRSGSPREPRERRCAQEEPAEASGQHGQEEPDGQQQEEPHAAGALRRSPMDSSRAARVKFVRARVHSYFHTEAPGTKLHSRSDCGHLKRAKHPIVERHLCKHCCPDVD